ncbi:MAG: calcium-binding protein, partial [Beijerinckiaceae bacterium]|nr:calcium-binding protein [Beijerinckiaceae bacterium]
MMDAAFKSHCPIAARKQLPASDLSILIHDRPERLMVRDCFQILNCIGDMIMPTQSYDKIIKTSSTVQLYKNSSPVLPAQTWTSLTQNNNTPVDLNNANSGGVAGEKNTLWFRGGDSGQKITGNTKKANVINGEDGNDSIIGADLDDWLYGSKGDDTLSGGKGSDRLSGGVGNDSILGGDGDDFVYGDDGNDILRGGADQDTLNGGSGNDQLYGDVGNDILFGGQGNDSLDGGVGNDVLYGDPAAGEISNGTKITFGNDTLIGGAGDDTLIGGRSGDTLTGNDGNDAFVYFPLDSQGRNGGSDTITDFQFEKDMLWLNCQNYGTAVTTSK